MPRIVAIYEYENGNFEICGDSQSLRALGEILILKSKLLDNFSAALSSEGQVIRISAIPHEAMTKAVVKT